jgi:hypothetical protein
VFSPKLKISVLFLNCYASFFSLYIGSANVPNYVSSVPQTVNSVKNTVTGKLSEIPKTSFAINNFNVYNGEVVFPLQDSISNLYGNKSVRPSYIEHVGGDTAPAVCCAMLFVDITVNNGDSLY